MSYIGKNVKFKDVNGYERTGHVITFNPIRKSIKIILEDGTFMNVDPEWVEKHLEKDASKYCPHGWGHRWVTYTGFTDVFEYCKECGKKKEDGDV